MKLYGILDASTGYDQANQDHLKMKNFLAAAGNEVICYARGEETFQCFAKKQNTALWQDIALWAIKNGFAKPALDAPRAYRE